MKKLFAMFLFAIAITLTFGRIAYSDELADRLADVPNPRVLGGWVSDPASVIAGRIPEINELIAGLEKSTSAEIAVVVLPTIGAMAPKDFAVALLKHWGIGKAGKDNGVLVLHVLDQRRIEIETGFGLEGILPDAKAHWITEEIAIPFFKKESIADGHYEVVRALVRAIEHPDISHKDLVAPLITQPGETTNEIPRVNERDAISLKHASAPTRFFHGLWHNIWTSIILIALGGGIYLWVTGWYLSRAKGKEPYAKYQLFNSGLSRLQYLSLLPIAASALIFESSRNGSFFSPLPILFALGFAMLRRRSSVLKSLRDQPRICQCGKTMRRLDEQQDDAYIEKGNVAEESIGSVDYDVWLCECSKSAIESYKGKSPAAACSQCHYRTYRVTNTHTLYPATTVSTGMREITHTCANCQHTIVDRTVIPVIATSSSQSRGSSSGRSAGSFGGGRSGGGGAGSSY